MSHKPALKPMNALERRAVAGLTSIIALRLLGLFLILPVFALYAEGLTGHTPFLVGLALGIYGLTQALLQIPYGMASDRFGRKPVIALGLVVYAVGSVLAAVSDSILGVILGRALQGAGAISAAAIAAIADLTREDQRTKAMAVVGVTIGASFIVSLTAGPLLANLVGVSGIFWLTAAMAVGGVALLFLWVPNPASETAHHESRPLPAHFLEVIRDPRLLRLDLGVFFLHSVLTALFVVVPLALVQLVGLPASRHWQVYIPVMLASVLFMLPLIWLAERRGLLRQVFTLAVFTLLASQAILYAGHTLLAGIVVGLIAFFTAFNLLEALLPSLVSRAAPRKSRGTAIGVYSTFQFLGAFVGGASGGLLYGRYGLVMVFVFSATLLLIWWWLAVTAPPLPSLAMRLIHVGRRAPEEAGALARELAAIRGVAEATVIAEQGIAYLKVDEHRLDGQALERYAQRV